MEFGIYLRPAKTYQKMIDLALKAEKMNFQGAYINDHVHGFGENIRDDYLEAWTVMTGIGLVTSKMRVGQIVLFNSLRNPAFLAKSIATLDNMLDGRYELMLGAGWNAPEYEAYDLMEQGRGMPSAKERVDRFDEAIQIIKLMLNHEVIDFDGNFWKLKNAYNLPQPIQKPMRISVGCSKPRMMNITAEHADGINIGGGFSKLESQIKQFDDIAGKYNKSVSDYYVSGFTTFHITTTSEETKEVARPIAERNEMTIDKAIEEHYIGNVEDIILKIRKAKDLGIDMTVLILPYDSDKEHKSIEYLYDNVITQI
jgi:alkanesulfonate monooxygenase SsuD/methylene tetrahydromethanopterin reductase-like flavin-dependent oxidoreductase (luciferase family)